MLNKVFKIKLIKLITMFLFSIRKFYDLKNLNCNFSKVPKSGFKLFEIKKKGVCCSKFKK